MLEIYRHDNRLYSGEICLSDFNTYPTIDNNSVSSSVFASRIKSDWSFDKQCKRNYEFRERSLQYYKENPSAVKDKSYSWRSHK